MDEERLRHSLAVARKMVEIAKEYKLSDSDIIKCFLIGYNHDIGYEFSKDGINHNIIGGKILKNNTVSFWREIYYHGKIQNEYKSEFLDILNMADMQIDRFGDDIGYDKRLEDIKDRYGVDSKVYIDCSKLISALKRKNNMNE